MLSMSLASFAQVALSEPSLTHKMRSECVMPMRFPAMARLNTPLAILVELVDSAPSWANRSPLLSE